MTARATYTNRTDYSCTDPAVNLADYVKGSSNPPSQSTLDMIATLIAVDTMDETSLATDSGGNITNALGNPTEVALLAFAHALGHDYEDIRRNTRGRSGQGELSAFLAEGKQIGFSSARKMMSWAVPRPEGGGHRLYSKGASEVLIARCGRQLVSSPSPGCGGEDEAADADAAARRVLLGVADTYARRGMRTLALAYRDLPAGVDFEATSDSVLNADGTEALEVETDLTFVSLVGEFFAVPAAILNSAAIGYLRSYAMTDPRLMLLLYSICK